jgi:hypothetical protein
MNLLQRLLVIAMLGFYTVPNAQKKFYLCFGKSVLASHGVSHYLAEHASLSG